MGAGVHVQKVHCRWLSDYSLENYLLPFSLATWWDGFFLFRQSTIVLHECEGLTWKISHGAVPLVTPQICKQPRPACTKWKKHIKKHKYSFSYRRIPRWHTHVTASKHTRLHPRFPPGTALIFSSEIIFNVKPTNKHLITNWGLFDFWWSSQQITSHQYAIMFTSHLPLKWLVDLYSNK